MKNCPKCKTEKDLAEFGKDRSRPDGLQRYCKKCCCAYQSKHRYDNKEAISAERAAYYRKNRRRVLKRMQDWQQENPGAVRALSQRRRARLVEAFDDGSVTGESVSAVFEAFRCRCVYCGSSGRLQEDHVVSIAAGGPHIIENIVPACQSCNASKNNTPVEVWYEQKFERRLPRRIARIVEAVSAFQRIAA